MATCALDYSNNQRVPQCAPAIIMLVVAMQPPVIAADWDAIELTLEDSGS